MTRYLLYVLLTDSMCSTIIFSLNLKIEKVDTFVANAEFYYILEDGLS